MAEIRDLITDGKGNFFAMMPNGDLIPVDDPRQFQEGKAMGAVRQLGAQVGIGEIEPGVERRLGGAGELVGILPEAAATVAPIPGARLLGLGAVGARAGRTAQRIQQVRQGQRAAAGFRPGIGGQSQAARQFRAAAASNPITNVLTRTGARREANQQLLNTTAGRAIGVQGAKKLTPDVMDEALENIGSMFRSAGQTIEGPVSLARAKEAARAATQTGTTVGKAKKRASRIIDDIPDEMDADDLQTLSSNLRSESRSLWKAGKANEARAVDEIATRVDETFMDALDPAVRDQVATARAQWAMMKVLERGATVNQQGDIAVRTIEKALRSRTAGGFRARTPEQEELQELVRVAAQHDDMIGDSGTATRQLFNWILGAAGVIGGGAAF